MKSKLLIRLWAIVLCVLLLVGTTAFTGMTAFAADVLVDAEDFEDNLRPQDPDTPDPSLPDDGSYEYVLSSLFNTASQKMWDLSQKIGFEVTAGQKVGGHTVAKITTNGASQYPQLYFWNEQRVASRVSIGNLFGAVDTGAYTGLRIWIHKPADNNFTGLSFMTGRMGSGYWPSTGFFTYTVTLPQGEFEGYVYLPFSEFVNNQGTALDPSSLLNFIGFRYTGSSNAICDLYIGELALWREGTAGSRDSGYVNVGTGVPLDKSKQYVYYQSTLFNQATAEVWARGKSSNMTAVPGSTAAGTYPAEVKSSIRLHTSKAQGSTNHEIYFWNELESSNRASNGLLFGTNVELTDYEGIRIWVKVDADHPYSMLTMYLGRMYTGYWPSEATGFFEYTIIIDGGFEGYVHIPFTHFINKAGESLTPDRLNFVGFKFNEGVTMDTDLYIANLQLYSPQTDVRQPVMIGAALDPNKQYEFLPSLVFADASQLMWDQSKIRGIKATVGITDADLIPAPGKTSVRLHTLGTHSYPDYYYWNEEAVQGRGTHGKFWGDTDTKNYEGIRIWMKADENNTYSKLTLYLGQMYTGYWPNEQTGFFAYDIAIPQGGFSGYVNIPFSWFVNLKGEKLNASNINFIGFRYNEEGYKETDFYISDLILYRQARPDGSVAPGGQIVGGNTVAPPPIIGADGTILDQVGDEYNDAYNELTHPGGNKLQGSEKPGTVTEAKIVWVIVGIAGGAALLGGIAAIAFILLKKRRNQGGTL